MRYGTVQHLSAKDFKRSTGVQRRTFEQMLAVIEKSLRAFGIPSQKVEDALIKSKQFHLPGKKKLWARDAAIEIVLVDATEQPIERPKKDNADTIAVKRSAILKKRK